MSYLLYIILILIIIYTFYRNRKIFDVFKHNREYIECYKLMLQDPISSYETINAYIEKETNLEFKNKARILKLYVDLCKDVDYSPNLKELDLKPIFIDNGKDDKRLVDLNSDSFIFLIMCLGKASYLHNREILNRINELVCELTPLENRAEVLTVRDTYSMFSKGAYPVFRELLDGSYKKYKYDKNLINVYKRICATNLVYKDEEIDEFYFNDLSIFVKTKVGELYMKDLGLFDRFYKEEKSENK